MIDDLNDDNFLIYAMKAYNKPGMIMSEFENDLKRIKYIKRLFKKYRITGDIKYRLILNHIIILYNVFGVEAATKLLFLKVSKRDYGLLKTFLIFLNFMPDIVNGVCGKNIRSTDLSVDMKVAGELRKI